MSNTVQGKFESSKNALTHGLTASNIERFPENIRESFRAYLAEQYDEFKPQTLNEKTFLERYAFNQFQLLRSESLVASALENLLVNPDDEKAQKRHAAMTRHLRALERSAKDALRELRLMITDRYVERAIAAQLDTVAESFLTPHHMINRALTVPKNRQEVRFVKLDAERSMAAQSTY